MRYGLAIDPGTEQSGVVMFDFDEKEVRWANKEMPNGDVLLECGADIADIILIEQIACMGMAVGAEVFETVFWSGRFAERAGIERVIRIPRSEVKLRLCNSTRAKDPNVRIAICDRFGGEKASKGTKKNPGPLYGVSSHAWAAMGLVCAYLDRLDEANRKAVV